MRIREIKINGMEQPMGYAFRNVTVSWKVGDTAAKRQEESIIRVAKDPMMQQIVAEVKGRLSSNAERVEFAYEPRTTYYVQVQVKGDNGESAVSEVTSFDTGKMQESWEAHWIGMEETDTFHPVFEKRFSVSKEVRRGRLYICGLGVYEAYLNGQKIGEDFLAPFFNDYRCAVQSQTYDVTPLLEETCTLSVFLGNGWYKGRLGYEGKSEVYGNRFACIAELHLEYEDGTEEVIRTDESWTYRKSQIESSDIYDGEKINRLAVDTQITKPAVILKKMEKTPLVDRYSMALKEMEEVKVRDILHTPAGETVLDFGQNFAGYVSFHADFPSGTEIVLNHGEILQNGNFYHDNYRTAKTEIIYISDGREEWVRPHFTYMGFRYVKVAGWPGEIKKEDFIGKVVYSAMNRTGYLETGHGIVNQLISNALWGLKSNFVDMPTDCPQRDERLGWTGDAQVFAPTASFFMDTRAFYRKFSWDMRNDQVLHDGAVANYLPNMDSPAVPNASSVWGDAATFIPMTVYESYGDKSVLEETYPLMRDWVEWIRRGDENREGGARYLFDYAFTFGDWLAMDGVTPQSMKGGTEDAYVSSVYYYASVCKLAQAAKVLERKTEEEEYLALSDKIKNAILYEYFAPSGRLTIDTQTGYIIALYFGIYRDRQILQQGLRQRLKKDGYRIKCGFVGAPLICETLAENGMADLALHIFLQEEFPSWLHCVNLGATTIWERWNSVLDDGSISGTGMNSLNHYAYGSVIHYAVQNLAGLKPLEAGYRRVKIQPCFDPRLKYVNCTYDSASGTYMANWRINADGTVHVHYEVPFDCEAVVVLPEYEEPELTLQAGVTDITYRPKRDYRDLFQWNSLLDDCKNNPAALDILKETLPAAYGMALSGDIENLGLSFAELREMLWFGFQPQDVDKAVERLFALKADLD